MSRFREDRIRDRKKHIQIKFLFLIPFNMLNLKKNVSEFSNITIHLRSTDGKLGAKTGLSACKRKMYAFDVSESNAKKL